MSHLLNIVVSLYVTLQPFGTALKHLRAAQVALVQIAGPTDGIDVSNLQQTTPTAFPKATLRASVASATKNTPSVIGACAIEFCRQLVNF